jgi:hypothetical protein
VRVGPPAEAWALLRLLPLWVCEVPVTAVTASLYILSSMRTSILRSIAIVVLSLHMLPLGLPLFCDTDRYCDHQMPVPSGPRIDSASNATICTNSLACAVMGTAALVLSTPLPVSVSDSYVVAIDVSTLARFDPQPPPPPPPQA